MMQIITQPDPNQKPLDPQKPVPVQPVSVQDYFRMLEEEWIRNQIAMKQKRFRRSIFDVMESQ